MTILLNLIIIIFVLTLFVKMFVRIIFLKYAITKSNIDSIKVQYEYHQNNLRKHAYTKILQNSIKAFFQNIVIYNM